MPTQNTVDPSRHEADEHTSFDLVSGKSLDLEEVLAILGFSPEAIEQTMQQLAQYDTEMTAKPSSGEGGR